MWKLDHQIFPEIIKVSVFTDHLPSKWLGLNFTCPVAEREPGVIIQFEISAFDIDIYLFEQPSILVALLDVDHIQLICLFLILFSNLNWGISLVLWKDGGCSLSSLGIPCNLGML